MSDEIGPEQAKINAHFAAVNDDLEALQKGKVEEAVERVDEYLRQQLPKDTVVDTTALARRAVNAARNLTDRTT
jgi:hypothetical protein